MKKTWMVMAGVLLMILMMTGCVEKKTNDLPDLKDEIALKAFEGAYTLEDDRAYGKWTLYFDRSLIEEVLKPSESYSLQVGASSYEMTTNPFAPEMVITFLPEELEAQAIEEGVIRTGTTESIKAREGEEELEIQAVYLKKEELNGTDLYEMSLTTYLSMKAAKNTFVYVDEDLSKGLNRPTHVKTNEGNVYKIKYYYDARQGSDTHTAAGAFAFLKARSNHEALLFRENPNRVDSVGTVQEPDTRDRLRYLGGMGELSEESTYTYNIVREDPSNRFIVQIKFSNTEKYQETVAFELEIGGATLCNITKIEEDLFKGTVEYATTSSIELVKNARVTGIFSSCTDFNLKDGYDYLKLRTETGEATAIQYASDTTTYQTTAASVTNALEAVDGSDQEYYLYKADGAGTSSIAFDEILPKMATLTVVAKNGNEAEFAVLWDQGAGTAEDPFRIYSIEDLAKVGSGSYSWDMNKAYKLMNELDFEDNASYEDAGHRSAYTTGSGWEPIGESYVKSFTGTFDGNNKTIMHLYINRPGTYCMGFFGYARETASITNLGLEEATVTGGELTGSFCGANTGTIENSYSINGNVTGENDTGGFSGWSGGTIRNSYSTGSVTGGDNTGGFSGGNNGTIENSYSRGDVNAIDYDLYRAGGFCGQNNGTIENSYSCGGVVTITVTNRGYGIGGFCGQNRRTIKNSYSTKSINFIGGNDVGGYDMGGFCGENEGGTIENSYSNGGISINTIYQNLIGGFCGEIDGGEIKGCFWDKNTSGKSSSDGGTGKTTSEMKTKSTFTAWDFDTTPIWAIDSGTSYPYLVDNEEIPHPGS